MIYAATITNTALRLRECRIVADLLLQRLSDEAWVEAVMERNVLQMASSVTIRRCSSMLRARLEPLGEGLWKMVRDGERELATQAALAGAVKQSRLLGDFMDITMREQRALFAKSLENRMWIDYIEGCRGRDPDMPHWGDGTVNKLRSVVFSMLAEAGYLKDTRSRLLQNVFINEQLSTYLHAQDEAYVIRCLGVME